MRFKEKSHNYAEKCFDLSFDRCASTRTQILLYHVCVQLKIETRSCFIHCDYCVSQPTCSLLCNIILPLIFLHYQLFCLLRSSYTVSCASSRVFASSVKQVLPPGVPRGVARNLTFLIYLPLNMM